MRQIEVLLVDDNQADVKLSLHAIREATSEHEVHVVRDGEQALEFLLAGPRSETQALRLILLDLKLPKVNGFEVLHAVKSDSGMREVPVVILTSSKQPEDLVRSYRLGANSYVQKPVDFEVFRDILHNIVRYWLKVNQPSPRTLPAG